MNKDPLLPEHLNVKEPEWELYLYFTGNKPHEFGYVLYQGKTKRDERIVGTLGIKGIFSTLRDFIHQKVGDINLSTELVLETKFHNRTLLP